MNNRTTILVDKHREQDAHDTLTALVQDSAHEMFARNPGRVESILNVSSTLLLPRPKFPMLAMLSLQPTVIDSDL